MTKTEILQKLVALSRELGREDRQMAILGEGNTSAAIGDGSFWVKASGSQLGTIDERGFSQVEIDLVLALLDEPGLDNTAINARLDAMVKPQNQRRPSIETFLHALCLKEGGAQWVGHVHTVSLLQILCSRLGAEPFRQHVYPDEIVVCGRHVAVVPYADVGLKLALAVRESLREFRREHGHNPKLLLMVNHGPVALGQTDAEVLSILLMADKWARVMLGTYTLGGPQYLPSEEMDRIDRRPDEEYRRKQLSRGR